MCNFITSILSFLRKAWREEDPCIPFGPSSKKNIFDGYYYEKISKAYWEEVLLKEKMAIQLNLHQMRAEELEKVNGILLDRLRAANCRVTIKEEDLTGMVVAEKVRKNFVRAGEQMEESKTMPNISKNGEIKERQKVARKKIDLDVVSGKIIWGEIIYE